MLFLIKQVGVFRRSKKNTALMLINLKAVHVYVVFDQASGCFSMQLEKNTALMLTNL